MVIVTYGRSGGLTGRNLAGVSRFGCLAEGVEEAQNRAALSRAALLELRS
jgi:hypothetical protein